MCKCAPRPPELPKCYNSFKYILSISGTRIPLQKHKLLFKTKTSLNQRNESLLQKSRSLTWKADTHRHTHTYTQISAHTCILIICLYKHIDTDYI